MTKTLSKDELELFLKQFPNLTEKEFKKLEIKLTSLYEDSIDLVERIVKNGFSQDNKDIVAKEWVIFCTKMIVKIEQMKSMTGTEKNRLLIALCVLIIIKHLPIGPVEKGILIIIVKEFLPEIVEGIIMATKQMHTVSAWIMRKLRGCCM